MPIFYTDTGSLGQLEVSGSGNILNLKGSGSNIFVISGSAGSLFEISDLSPSANVFTISSGSIDVFTIGSSKNVSISGSLIVTGSITGSLLGTASFALNAGGGSGAGFPFSGSAIITGSIILTSGSGFQAITASETLLPGDLVNIFSGGVRRAINTNVTRSIHGFVTASYLATEPVVVFYSGLLTGESDLIPGTRYFLDSNAGEYTSTPPTTSGRLSQEIGVAISTTTILFQPGPAIIT